MKVSVSIGLAALLIILQSTVADATPALVGTTTDPTGINNLVVDSTIYDVTFSATTLNSFTQGATTSVDATSALIAALNALSVTELANFAAESGYFLDVDNSLTAWDGAECTVVCSASNDWFAIEGVGPWTLGPVPAGTNFEYLEAADFTAVGQVPTTGVPEPFSLGLFGAGLGALFMLRRRSNGRSAS